MTTKESKTEELTYNDFTASVINDYKVACRSREMSLMGRREVLSGKGSFGIFGDGKELAQIAMARSSYNPFQEKEPKASPHLNK